MPDNDIDDILEHLDKPIYINKNRFLYIFVVWDHHSTSEEKAGLVFEIIKEHQKSYRRKDIKLRRQRDLTRDMMKEFIYLSI